MRCRHGIYVGIGIYLPEDCAFYVLAFRYRVNKEDPIKEICQQWLESLKTKRLCCPWREMKTEFQKGIPGIAGGFCMALKGAIKFGNEEREDH